MKCDPACRWWREQSGSAHVLCPVSSDFSWSWKRPECDTYDPVLPGEVVKRDGVNAFLVWSGGDPAMPTRKTVEEYRARKEPRP